jgi:hypothetical protein
MEDKAIIVGEATIVKPEEETVTAALRPKKTCKTCNGRGVYKFINGDYETEKRCQCVKMRSLSPYELRQLEKGKV